MTALLELDRVSKRFGGLLAVHNLSFAMREGEILGRIGPNGAGKSTLFNLINGVFTPNSGRIVFNGADITDERPFMVARHGIARTHQIVQPLTNMTVLDNCTVSACFGRENLPLHRATEAARAAARSSVSTTGCILRRCISPSPARSGSNSLARSRRSRNSCCWTKCSPD